MTPLTSSRMVRPLSPIWSARGRNSANKLKGKIHAALAWSVRLSINPCFPRSPDFWFVLSIIRLGEVFISVDVNVAAWEFGSLSAAIFASRDKGGSEGKTGEEEKSRKWMSYLSLSLPVHITWYFDGCFLQGFIFVYWLDEFLWNKICKKIVEFIFEEDNDLSIKKKEMWSREAEKWRQWMDYQCLCFLSSIA